VGNLLTDSSTFSALAKTYSNFLVPAMKIKVGTSDIASTLKVGITDVSITLDLDNASSVDFTVINVYDLKSTAFYGNVKSTIKLGAVLTVELGYGSSLTKVFQGYVANLNMEFGEIPKISVVATDVRALMGRNIREVTHKDLKKASAVVSKIMEIYSKVSKVKVTDTPEQEDPFIQNDSDLEYILKELCPKTNSEFFVLGDTAYFRKMHDPDKEITTLSPGSGLISFQCNTTYVDEVIQIYGHDEQTNKPVTAKKDAKSDTKSASALSKKPVRELKISDTIDATKAENIAAYELEQLMKSSQQGGGTCIGLPELCPGRYLKIEKLDESVNKTYYLKTVTHSFSESGFTTNFTIGGFK